MRGHPAESRIGMRAFIISLALGAAQAGSFATPECVQEYSECQADDECKDNSILLPPRMPLAA